MSPARDELPPGLRALWADDDGRPAARRGGLTVVRVVQAAAELADDEGLEALSMARVAERLGYTPMALYRHVRNKDELLQLMFDVAVGAPPTVGSPAHEGWRPGLERWSRELLAVLQRHPWMLQIPISGPPITPGRLAWLDRGLAALAETGLSEDEKAAVTLLLNGHVFWWGRLARDFDASGTDQDPSASGALLSSLVDAERFPALRRALDAGFLDDETDDFAWGLDRILDGVEQLVAQRSAATR